MKKYSLLWILLLFNFISKSQTNVFPSNGNVGVGTTLPENAESWDKVMEIKGIVHSKFLVSSDAIQSGIWSHNIGFYGALPGGIIGTKTAHNFSIMTGSSPKMAILLNGNVGIGTNAPAEKLSVNGKIRAREIKVETSNWPDYVFSKGYYLPSLKDIEEHINKNGHLQGIPSANEVISNGIELGDLNARLLKKIEELTLHLIAMEKEANRAKYLFVKQQKDILDQKAAMKQLLTRVKRIEAQ